MYRFFCTSQRPWAGGSTAIEAEACACAVAMSMTYPGHGLATPPRRWSSTFGASSWDRELDQAERPTPGLKGPSSRGRQPRIREARDREQPADVCAGIVTVADLSLLPVESLEDTERLVTADGPSASSAIVGGRSARSASPRSASASIRRGDGEAGRAWRRRTPGDRAAAAPGSIERPDAGSATSITALIVSSRK